MTVIQLPKVKTKEVKGYMPDRLEEILQSNKTLSETLHHHILFAQQMQEVGRYEEAQVQWDLVTQILTALGKKAN